MESVQTKEIAEAVLSASSAIASLLLVFIAFVMAKADALPEATPDKVLKKYSNVAMVGIVLVSACALVTLSAYGWLFYSTCRSLLYLWSIGFPAVTILFVAFSAYVVARD
jgi:hypothetical protein